MKRILRFALTLLAALVIANGGHDQIHDQPAHDGEDRIGSDLKDAAEQREPGAACFLRPPEQPVDPAPQPIGHRVIVVRLFLSLMPHPHASKLRLREDLFDFLANRLGLIGRLRRLHGRRGNRDVIAPRWPRQQRHERDAAGEEKA